MPVSANARENTMSLRIASVLAWAWGILSVLTSLGPLSRFDRLGWAGRTTAIWLLCAGIALAVVGFGLPRRRVYAARVAIIVCGLWLITQLIVVTRVLRGSGTWDRTTWIIVGTQILCCLVILAVVMANRHALSANGETADQIAPTNAA